MPGGPRSDLVRADGLRAGLGILLIAIALGAHPLLLALLLCRSVFWAGCAFAGRAPHAGRWWFPGMPIPRRISGQHSMRCPHRPFSLIGRRSSSTRTARPSRPFPVSVRISADECPARSRAQASARTVLRGAEGERVELVERVPVERSFEVSIRRLAGNDRVSTAVLHFQDTTQSRRVEQMRADFVANASHELRTPLASVLGFVETLQGPAKKNDAARARSLPRDHRGAGAADDAAHQRPAFAVSPRDARAYSALGNRGSRVARAASLRPAGGLAAERKVTLAADLPEGGDFNVTGDRDELVRLIENLIETRSNMAVRAARCR